MVLLTKEPETTAPIEVSVDWKPHPGPQTEALTRQEFELLYGGARGGGKTEAGMAWMVAPNIINHPLYKGLVVRRHADDLSDWIARSRLFYRKLSPVFAGNPPIIRFPCGAYIKTGHLKDKDAYQKYLGHEYQRILIEELTLIPSEESYEKLISSCRSSVAELKPQVFATTNPGGPGHGWVKARWVDTCRLKPFLDPESGMTRIFIPSTLDDNPALMKNDPLYVRRIEALKDFKLRMAWRWGSWDIFAGQFFDEWDEKIHVIDPFVIPSSWYVYGTLDWGYAAPAAYLWVAVDPKGNHYVFREHYGTRAIPERLAKTVLDRTQRRESEMFIMTLAGPDCWAKNQYGKGKDDEQATVMSVQQKMDDVGLFLTMANNDRISGWQALRSLLYHDANCKPKLYVFKNCKNTIRVIPNMVHSETDVEDMSDEGEDHIPEALRYLAMHTVGPVQKDLDEQSDHQKWVEKHTVPDGSGPIEDVLPWDNDL